MVFPDIPHGRYLVIVRPHADDFHRSVVVQDLIDQPVLNADSARIGPGKVAHQLLIWWRALVGVSMEDVQEAASLGFEA